MNNNKMNICELLSAYDHATDTIIRRHLGIALCRAIDLYTDDSTICSKNDVTSEEVRVGKTVNKVTAIKMYRDRTGRNLKECKEEIENYFARMGFEFYKPPYNSHSPYSCDY